MTCLTLSLGKKTRILLLYRHGGACCGNGLGTWQGEPFVLPLILHSSSSWSHPQYGLHHWSFRLCTSDVTQLNNNRSVHGVLYFLEGSSHLGFGPRARTVELVLDDDI